MILSQAYSGTTDYVPRVRLTLGFTTAILLSMLGLASIAIAQTPKCPSGYFYSGGRPIYQVGKSAPYWIGGRCIAIKSTPAGFQPIGPVPIYPSYYLLTILYAMPGEDSEAKYGAGSEVGSKSEDTKSFKKGITAEVETNFFDIKSGYASTTKDGTSFEIKQENISTLVVDGVPNVNNTIVHDEDMFYLWTNPEIDITQVSPTAILQSIAPHGSDQMTIVPVTARELKNPTLMPGWKSLALAALKDGDRASILSMDPFFANAAPGSGRFVKIDTLQLDGPDNPGDPLTGDGLEVDSEQTMSNITGNEKTVSLSIEVGGRYLLA